jgi:hypothetical protein
VNKFDTKNLFGGKIDTIPMAGGIFEVCPFLVPVFFLMFVFDSMT